MSDLAGALAGLFSGISVSSSGGRKKKVIHGRIPTNAASANSNRGPAVVKEVHHHHYHNNTSDSSVSVGSQPSAPVIVEAIPVPSAPSAPEPCASAKKGGANPDSAANMPPPPAYIEQQPLPPHWERMVTPDGRYYYVNHLTKATSWDRPVD